MTSSMTFTWTRDGDRITSTCPRCHATETSRWPADIRRWQRSHSTLACWRGRNRAMEGPRSDAGAETVLPLTPTSERPVEARFTQPNEGDPA